LNLTARDTIFALSSGGFPAGVAVVRVSGPRALDVASILAGTVPGPRHASLRWIRKRNGDRIDEGLVLAFPAPASFTGEDAVEFQLHGGRAVVTALLQELAKACARLNPASSRGAPSTAAGSTSSRSKAWPI
jgi:tRNA modification GTPase